MPAEIARLDWMKCLRLGDDLMVEVKVAPSAQRATLRNDSLFFLLHT
jgi:hypothetical protein